MKPWHIKKAWEKYGAIYYHNRRLTKKVFSHEGEEFMFVLEGTHEFVYGNKRHILEPGDSIYFDSSVPHTGRSIEKSPQSCPCSVIPISDHDGKIPFEKRSLKSNTYDMVF